MNGSTFQYGRAYGVALLVGPTPLAIVLTLMTVGAASLNGPAEQITAGLIVGPVIWIIGFVAWAVGLYVLIPVWWLLRRFGWGGPWQAVALGGLSVAIIWLAAVIGDGLDSSDNMWAFMGALSGALAGYFGWRAGSRPEAPA